MSDIFSFLKKTPGQPPEEDNEPRDETAGQPSSDKTPGRRPPKEGSERAYPALPVVKGAAIHHGDLFFTCPGCGQVNRLPCDMIHPVFGERTLCNSCGVLVHISGFDPFSMKASDIVINSGVPVRLIEFEDWYRNHPVTLALVNRKKQQTHLEYGLWVYCLKCHHEFPAAVLLNIPEIWDPRVMMRSGIDKAHIREMAAVKAGKCPVCENRIIMVIITDIPDRVIHLIEDLEYSWE